MDKHFLHFLYFKLKSLVIIKMSCNSCNPNYFSNLKYYWTPESSLHTSSYDPFRNLGNPKYDYGQRIISENYYAVQGNEWSLRSNVTPDNSPIILPTKKDFQTVKDGYLTVDNTWKNKWSCS
jgi:hypothetical protein